MKQVDFLLKSPIEIMDGGKIVPCDKLIMTAPSVSMMRYAMPLKQGLLSSMVKLNKQINAEQSKDQGGENQGELTGEAVLSILYMSDLDINKYTETFKDLCAEGAVKLKNGDKMQSHLIDKMSAEDFESLLGEYVANFIIGSLLSRTQTK